MRVFQPLQSWNPSPKRGKDLKRFKALAFPRMRAVLGIAINDSP